MKQIGDSKKYSMTLTEFIEFCKTYEDKTEIIVELQNTTKGYHDGVSFVEKPVQIVCFQLTADVIK